ncbi:PilT/PilU family type 4a pilus ATPase [Candidatus Dependentiae bacterium]|nr:PilT/PilU family type 4a pilus ATPase [Candidatus Dependentiae bacterium]
MNIRDVLRLMVKNKASDIHMKVGSPPLLRINGELQPSNLPKLDMDTIRKVTYYFLQTEERKQKFEKDKEMDLSHSEPGVARFRVNIFKARGSYGIVVRIVPVEIPSFSDLHLPPILKEIALEPRGLVLVTGTTGSGKSTSLAAMIDYINTHRRCHIVTIEDPIEFLHKDKLSSITQREIGIDTYNFESALKHVLRQDPDIIMVGEIRDLETADTAINAALTGHLVISTIHTNSAAGAVPRFLAMGVKPFLLSPSLNAIVGQRLVRRICEHCKTEDKIEDKKMEEIKEMLSNIPESSREKLSEKELDTLKFYKGKGCDKCYGLGYKGRIGIFEILIMTPEIEQLISESRVSENIIQESAVKNGMITMVQDGLLKAKDGITSIGEVFRAAD